jgi:hypothetical protein
MCLPVLRLERDTIWSAKYLCLGGKNQILPSTGCFGRPYVGVNNMRSIELSLSLRFQ